MIIDRKISVHLQDFPVLDFIQSDENLTVKMDLVRSVCSTVLGIRDQRNLRVRLPLQKLSIVGKNAYDLEDFKEIICDEVNVKEVFFGNDFSNYGELKLQINFKKIGTKYGAKVKEITQAMRENNWRKIDDQAIEIAGLKLVDDEFELKLATKNFDEKKLAIMPLPSNDLLVILDIEINKDLADEGIARDIVRSIQQNRKVANLDISEKIDLQIYSSNPRILEVAKNFENYISQQVLSNGIKISSQKISSPMFCYENVIEDGDLTVILK